MRKKFWFQVLTGAVAGILYALSLEHFISELWEMLGKPTVWQTIAFCAPAFGFLPALWKSKDSSLTNILNYAGIGSLIWLAYIMVLHATTLRYILVASSFSLVLAYGVLWYYDNAINWLKSLSNLIAIISTAIFSYYYMFEHWDLLVKQPEIWQTEILPVGGAMLLFIAVLAPLAVSPRTRSFMHYCVVMGLGLGLTVWFIKHIAIQ